MKKEVPKIVFLIVVFFTTLLYASIAYADSDIKEMEKPSKNSTSNIYLISELYEYIGRILPKTTVQQFKSNFETADENIHIYKDNTLHEEVTSGYVATNMVVKFEGTEKIYTLSVVGDFDGNGMANQIELKQLINHIVFSGKYSIEGIQLISADINGDEKVNQIDLTVLINYIVYGRLSIGEIDRPENPLIEVVKGEKEGEGPYTSEVEFKITPKKSDNVNKITYMISGSNNVSETEIPEDGIIKLSEDGIYKITAYTYSKNGAKSSGATLVINKSTKEIADENIGLSMKINNKDGEEYRENTWTNQSVWIEVIKTKDEIANGVEVDVETTYTITGKTTIAIPSDRPIILKESGEYTISAQSVDSIGRKKTKKYKVKIDKDQPTNSTVEFAEETTGGYYNTIINGTIKHGKDILSGIKKVTYELQGSEIKEETEIEDEGKIVITEDGEIILVIRTYDIAGNITKSEQKILIDKTAPTDIILNSSNITGTSFDLEATATDELSGIKKYEFYIDEDLLKTDETSANSSNASAKAQESKTHKVKVLVTDIAGNVGETEIEVTNAKLENSEIARVEFVITDYLVSNEETNTDITKVQKIVSNTSSSSQSKYIQLSVDRDSEDYSNTITTNGLQGELEGIIKIVRKDGIEVTDFNFFPEELIMEFKYSSDINGTDSKHISHAEICGINMYPIIDEINSKVEEESMSVAIETLLQLEKNNYFKILEKKIQGTTSYTRLEISKLTLNGIDLPFDIVDKTKE